jgi:oligopeptidase A
LREEHSDQEINNTPEDKVLAGMFELVEKLYGIHIVSAAASKIFSAGTQM